MKVQFQPHRKHTTSPLLSVAGVVNKLSVDEALSVGKM
jgi:hypothetical protein